MSKLTVEEWVTRRRDLLCVKRERTGRLDVKVRYGVQAAELTKVLDYIAAHRPALAEDKDASLTDLIEQLQKAEAQNAALETTVRRYMEAYGLNDEVPDRTSVASEGQDGSR